MPRAQAQAFLGRPAADDAPPTRSKGDVVVVHGLTSDTGRAHNGALAIVAGPATNGRFAIELVHARKTISARPQNLRAASDAEASAARDMAGRRPIAEMAAAAPRSSRADDVKMYERVRSIDARHAKVAKTLAEGLSAAPPLVWYAEGDTPGLCPANIVAMLPHGNAGHHLDESRSPEMLTQREAAEMARAGVRLLRQAFHDMNATLAKHQAAPARLAALQNFHISQPNVRVDMCVLKAGAQLLVDSFFADEKSHGFTPEDMKVMYISGSYFCDDKELQEHFAFFLSNLLFEWIVYRGLAKVDAKMKQVADKVLDNVIRTLEAPACPLKEDRVLAYVYFARSFERTRTGDIAGGVRDLDLACAKGGARFQRSRIPVRLQAGDLDGATADMEAVVDADAHDDDRHLKDTLFMMAAFRGKESRDEEGRTYFQWAVRCAARHRYLFGEPSARRANPYNPKGSATVVGFITNVAYQRYGTPEQRAAHLKSGGLSYGDLQTGLSALVGMPRAQAQAFLGRPAADDAPPTRSKGDVVVVHGLTSDAGRAHNGALAIVAGSAKNGRYAIDLVHARKTISARPRNRLRAFPRGRGTSARHRRTRKFPPRARPRGDDRWRRWRRRRRRGLRALTRWRLSRSASRTPASRPKNCPRAARFPPVLSRQRPLSPPVRTSPKTTRTRPATVTSRSYAEPCPATPADGSRRPATPAWTGIQRISRPLGSSARQAKRTASPRR